MSLEKRSPSPGESLVWRRSVSPDLVRSREDYRYMEDIKSGDMSGTSRFLGRGAHSPEQRMDSTSPNTTQYRQSSTSKYRYYKEDERSDDKDESEIRNGRVSSTESPPRPEFLDYPEFLDKC